MMPNAPPPWYAVYQQTRRWLKAGVVATLVHDLRAPAMTGINAPPAPPHAGGGGKVHVAEAVHYLYARKYITGSSG